MMQYIFKYFLDRQLITLSQNAKIMQGMGKNK